MREDPPFFEQGALRLTYVLEVRSELIFQPDRLIEYDKPVFRVLEQCGERAIKVGHVLRHALEMHAFGQLLKMRLNPLHVRSAASSAPILRRRRSWRPATWRISSSALWMSPQGAKLASWADADGGSVFERPWLVGSKVRIDSTSSSKSSTLTGCSCVTGKTSKMPPRTLNCPGPSTRVVPFVTHRRKSLCRFLELEALPFLDRDVAPPRTHRKESIDPRPPARRRSPRQAPARQAR